MYKEVCSTNAIVGENESSERSDCSGAQYVGQRTRSAIANAVMRQVQFCEMSVAQKTLCDESALFVVDL